MNYIVALSGGLYCFYYKQGGIWFCEYDGALWSKGKELVAQARADYSIKLADDGLSLVYGLPFSDDVHMLMSQFVRVGDTLEITQQADNIGLMGGPLGVYNKYVPVTQKHYLAVYSDGGFESRLGYREIYGDEVGKYNLIHSSIHKFGDYSVLATKYDLHVACVVRGVFGSRLIYKKKRAEKFSPGIVVAEGQDLDNIVLYIENDEVHLLFTRNDRLYCVRAEGADGQKWGFLPLNQHEQSNYEATNITKAVFLTDNRHGFLINELLVDTKKPWEVQVFWQLILGFYNNIKPQKAANTPMPAKYKDYNEVQDEFFGNMEVELMGHITKLGDNTNSL